MPFLLCLLEALSCNTQADTQQNRTFSMPWQLTASLLPTLKVLKVNYLLLCSLKKISSCATHQNMNLHNRDMQQTQAEPSGQWAGVLAAFCNSCCAFCPFLCWVHGLGGWAGKSRHLLNTGMFRDGRKRLIERYLLFSSVQMLAFCLMTTTWKNICFRKK